MSKSKGPQEQRHSGVAGTHAWLEQNPRQVALMLYELARSRRRSVEDENILHIFMRAIETPVDSQKTETYLEWNLKHFFRSRKFLFSESDKSLLVSNFCFGEDATMLTYDYIGARLSEAF